MPRWPTNEPNESRDRDENPDQGWDLSEGLDPEGPSAADLDTFGDELSTCPNCKESIYDQTPICPHCGHVLEEQPRSAPLWVVGVVAGLVVLLLIFAF